MKFTRLIALAAICALPQHQPAAGAEMLVKAPPKEKKKDIKTPEFDWTGFYFGGHIGYAAASSKWSASLLGGPEPAVSGVIDMFNSYDAFKGTGSFFHGLQGGYNVMLPSRVVVGVEADVSPPNTIAGNQTFATPLVGEANYSDTLLLSGTARARVGYAFDRWMAYGTGGFAWAYDSLTRTQSVGTPSGGSASGGTSEGAFLWRLGWAAGAGVEVPVAGGWTAKIEYLLSDYGAKSVVFPAGAQRFDSDLTMQSVKLGMNYQLGADLGKSDVFSKGPSPLDLDNFSLHGQTTFVGQYALPFNSPYVGQHSLYANSGRETWDVDFFIGIRPWQGAELWINPEIDQGFGLSGVFGVAGFPSAEAYKVGSSYPYARLPRMFFRQTIDLGGETEKVEGGANQFAGSQTSDRLVITVGKLSVVDIFDTNKYAHDPRSDFLNWVVVDTGAFDYAADAWAFTYGGAAEWYQDKWTFRVGVFDAPAVPNSTDLDPTFRQFQLDGEIERRYELWDQPGKIAVTGYLTRARMGNFNDAIAQAQFTGTTADITAVRTYTSKTGIAANLEQQIIPNVGVFARAGWTRGLLEADAFTDADRSLSGGASLSGKLWGRPDDTFGIAGIYNVITQAHEEYFDFGGLTALLGDGQLPHPGPEQIIEAYYGFPIDAWRVTADYQFIVNPAYNRDRGPVSVVAARLHTQF
jgi:high affinity Mn2+ porin